MSDDDRAFKDLDPKKTAELLKKVITDQNKMGELSFAMAHVAKCEYCRTLAKILNLGQLAMIKHSKGDGR